MPECIPPDYPQFPVTTYGETKVAAERLGLQWAERTGGDFRCLRYPIVMQPFPPSGAHASYASLASLHALHKRKYCFPISQSIRTAMIHVDDVIDQTINFMNAPRDRLKLRIYNICGFSAKVREVQDEIESQLNDTNFSYQSPPNDEAQLVVGSWPQNLDINAASEDWLFAPRVKTLKEAVRLTIAAQREGIAAGYTLD